MESMPEKLSFFERFSSTSSKEVRKLPEPLTLEKATPQKVRELLATEPRFLPTYEQVALAFQGEEGYKFRANYFHSREVPPRYEIWTKEYIQSLAGYLLQRAKEMGAKPNPYECLKAVEVGAGDGRLSFFLQNELENTAPGLIELVATDNHSEKGINPVLKDFVKKMDCQDALSHQPQIVISSWMPRGEDWTVNFRDTASMQEYILIGDIKKGETCGTRETWREFPGFTMEELQDLRKYQIGRSDIIDKYSPKFKIEAQQTTTVCFRRKSNGKE